MDFLSLKNFIEQTKIDKSFLEQFNLNFKDVNEIKTFLSFIDFLEQELKDHISKLSYCSDNFQIGYNIPQLGKEFDLLRLGENYNISIEYKAEATIDKLKQQLITNHYYLKFFEQTTYYFSYCMETNTFIKGYIDEREKFTFSTASPQELVNLMEEQNVVEPNQLTYDSSFNIKNYLVSPFNDTDRFIQGSYLLTSHQESIKKDMLEKDIRIFFVEGKPGTGKSLLLYDVAKQFISNNEYQNIEIIHTGNLNIGHNNLTEEGFKINPIKNYTNIFKNKKLKYLFVDESQRLKEDQMYDLINYSKETGIKIFFFADGEQTLHNSEVNLKICDKIANYIAENGGEKYKLKSKIRSNYEMAQFIKKVIKLPINLNKEQRTKNDDKKIEVKYFKDYADAKLFMNKIKNNNFVTLGYATSRFNPDPLNKVPDTDYVAHSVIGQEFDNVAVILDNNFYYEKNNNNYRLMGTNRSYYHSTKMFYQNITRVREKLIILVIDNPDIFVKISSTLSNV